MSRSDIRKRFSGTRLLAPGQAKRRLKDRRGFTLLESIATIVIAGIIAMMIIPYFNSGITESHRPALLLQDAVALELIMEEFNAFYSQTLKNQAALVDLRDNQIPAVNSNNSKTIASTPPYTVLYKIEEKKFIAFNNTGDEVDDTGGTNRVLKVTLRSNTNPGYELTQLFTVQK